MVRTAIRQAMRIMGHQYVMGRNIGEALDRSLEKGHRMYRHSFDMLGEAALTGEDAARYMEAYRSAILAIGNRERPDDIFEAPSISVKLSALHPRFELGQRERVLRDLVPRLLELAQLAMANRMALTVDTEEADRLMLTLDVFAAVLLDPSLKGWNGLGMALQTYQKRAPAVRLPIRRARKAACGNPHRADRSCSRPRPPFRRPLDRPQASLACRPRRRPGRQSPHGRYRGHAG